MKALAIVLTAAGCTLGLTHLAQRAWFSAPLGAEDAILVLLAAIAIHLTARGNP
jgi:hypothetical protein